MLKSASEIVSVSPASAALLSIYYSQMPEVKFSEARSLAKSSVIEEYKVAFVRHRNTFSGVHTYLHRWTRLKGNVLQHCQDIIAKKKAKNENNSLTIRPCEISARCFRNSTSSPVTGRQRLRRNVLQDGSQAAFISCRFGFLSLCSVTGHGEQRRLTSFLRRRGGN